MDSRSLPPLRSLPRVFVPGASATAESIELPREEVDKFRKVLRLEEGSQIAVLPNDGSVIRCEFRARLAWPVGVEHPETESPQKVTLAQALPKADRVETVLRMATEIGVAAFVLFGADRSVVKWDQAKKAERLRRLEAILREAAEQSFRTRIPELSFADDLAAVLRAHPKAIVLSEIEGLNKKLPQKKGDITIVVGPEGGWSPKELGLIGDRGVTLGPRVLRADTAGPAAAACLLLEVE